LIKENLLYTPYYCEENIWHLCNNPVFANFERIVVIISNEQKKCAFYSQKLSTQNNFIPVIWDYHVILLIKQESWLVYDFDTILSFPTEIGEYIDKTFNNKYNKMYLPKFRLISANHYIKKFSSDRSHMEQNGKWIHKPPFWQPIINKESTFYNFINFNNDFIGSIINFENFLYKFTSHGKL
jgi:hypothetical protein